VVLSLRKRYSVVRRGGRTPTTGNFASSGELGGDVTNNPWQESTPDSSNVSQSHHTINHRLSYDFGSGVIVLPDDGIWLDGVESDSEDEDGDGNIAGDQATPERAVSEDDQGSGSSDGQTITGLSRTRYGTYFHHPERRWQSVPGAFPTSS
jgi:calcium permeable stress-gated cation channel